VNPLSNSCPPPPLQNKSSFNRSMQPPPPPPPPPPAPAPTKGHKAPSHATLACASKFQVTCSKKRGQKKLCMLGHDDLNCKCILNGFASAAQWWQQCRHGPPIYKRGVALKHQLHGPAGAFDNRKPLHLHALLLARMAARRRAVAAADQPPFPKAPPKQPLLLLCAAAVSRLITAGLGTTANAPLPAPKMHTLSRYAATLINPSSPPSSRQGVPSARIARLHQLRVAPAVALGREAPALRRRAQIVAGGGGGGGGGE